MKMDPDRRPIWLAFCVLGIAIAAALWLWLGRGVALTGINAPDRAVHATQSSADAPTEALSPPGNPERVAKLQLGWGESLTDPAEVDPLPPDGTPLLAMFEDLDRRARNGDAQAACRLGAELLRCQNAPAAAVNELRAAHYMASQALTTEQIETMADTVLKHNAQYALTKHVCNGFDVAAQLPPARYFELGARRGHIPSMTQFISTSMRLHDVYRDPQIIVLFNQSAARYLITALEAGDFEAFELWRSAVRDSESPLQPLLPERMRDPWLAHGVGQRILARWPGSVSASALVGGTTGLDSEQTAEADRLFQQFESRWDGEHPTGRWETDLRDIATFRCDATFTD